MGRHDDILRHKKSAKDFGGKMFGKVILKRPRKRLRNNIKMDLTAQIKGGYNRLVI